MITRCCAAPPTPTGQSEVPPYETVCDNLTQLSGAQWDAYVNGLMGKRVAGWTGWITWAGNHGTDRWVEISMDPPGSGSFLPDVHVLVTQRESGVPGDKVTFSGTIDFARFECLIKLHDGSVWLAEKESALQSTQGLDAPQTLVAAAATATTTATLTVSATATTTATARTCAPRMSFVSDITIPDDTVFKPEESYEKTWRVKNSGSCEWTSNYSVVFVKGDSLGSTGPQTLDKVVAPGETTDITVQMTAPTQDGRYTSWWQMRDDSGHPIGDSFYARILVRKPRPTPTSTPEPKSGLAQIFEQKDACDAAQSFVKEKLWSPYTAVFPSCPSIILWGSGSSMGNDPKTPGLYQLNSYVDSENRMGAMIRTYFRCDVQYSNSKQAWVPEALQFMDMNGNVLP